MTVTGKRDDAVLNQRDPNKRAKRTPGQDLLDALAATQEDAKQTGSSKLTMRQIDAAIAADRRGRL
jgi:hypothetical protein